MALKVDPRKTYARIVVDEEDGKEYKVELRKLNHGDMERRRQEGVKLRKKSRKNGKGRSREQMEYDSKAVSDWTYMRGIVSWEFPFPVTIQDFAELDPTITRQIKRHFRELNPSIANELRDVEDDLEEEFEDDLEDEDGDENEGEDNESPTHLSAVEDESEEPENQQVFGEYNGPKERAETS